MNKKLAPLRAENDVTHAPQLKLHERMNKRQIWSGCDVIWSKQKSRRRNKKNIAGHVLTFNSKNFHWLNRKLNLERTMNGLGKTFRKKSDPKNRKNSKNRSEIAACEQKTTSEKANFCLNTVFSLYFKFRAKKFHAAKPFAFWLHSCFGVTKITTPIWLQKSRKCDNRS